ncbi:MAG: phage portal protein [Eubacteriales bacterium]|jgi:HK97 family phage portal protein
MKIVNRIASWIVNKATTTVNPEQWFTNYFGGGSPTKAGIVINNDNALQISTYFACVRNISEDIAKLPLITYKPLSPQGRERMKDHPVYSILHDASNSEMTAMTLRETLTAHAINWGNGYAYIERDRFGSVTALWPLRPDRVRPYRDKGSLRIYYEVSDDNGQKNTFAAFDILHIHGLGYDGLLGYNVGRYSRECIGSLAAAQEHAAYYFKNGSNSSGILELPFAMSQKAKDNLKASFEKEYGGAANTNKTIVLEEGAKFNKTSIPPEEAQLLETRQFSVPEICRWFRMPPNKVADTTRAQGWSTLEQTNTDYVTDTLMPWFVRWEQEIGRKLFTIDDIEQGLFVRHLADALLRGDIAARYGAYAVGRQWGWLSADDIREKEDMNPLPDEKGQIYLTPLNMIPAGTEQQQVNLTKQNDIQNQPPDKQQDEALNAIKESILDDIAVRIANAEISEIEKHIDKGFEGFQKWLNDFYKSHERYCSLCLERYIKLPASVAKEMIASNRFNPDKDDIQIQFAIFRDSIRQKHKEFIRGKI